MREEIPSMVSMPLDSVEFSFVNTGPDAKLRERLVTRTWAQLRENLTCAHVHRELRFTIR
jgi:hypothetical protein